jgi:hypothetical protein
MAAVAVPVTVHRTDSALLRCDFFESYPALLFLSIEYLALNATMLARVLG